MKTDKENPLSEGERAILKHPRMKAENDNPATQHVGKIDKRKLIIYSEILKPKF